METKETGEHARDESEPHADDWFTNPSEREDYGSDGEDGKDAEEAEKKKKARYIEICRDESFIYSMDRKAAFYTRIPHTIDEKMIDVWIKLEPLEYASEDYTYPPKYYLEHYLIRPKRKQIQFLCWYRAASKTPFSMPSSSTKEKSTTSPPPMARRFATMSRIRSTSRYEGLP